jgi:hypothetical protein
MELDANRDFAGHLSNFCGKICRFSNTSSPKSTADSRCSFFFSYSLWPSCFFDMCVIFDLSLIFLRLPHHCRRRTLYNHLAWQLCGLHAPEQVCTLDSLPPPSMGRSNRDNYIAQAPSRAIASHAASQYNSDSDLESPVFDAPDGDGNSSRCKFVSVTIAARTLSAHPDSISLEALLFCSPLSRRRAHPLRGRRGTVPVSHVNIRSARCCYSTGRPRTSPEPNERDFWIRK